MSGDNTIEVQSKWDQYSIFITAEHFGTPKCKLTSEHFTAKCYFLWTVSLSLAKQETPLEPRLSPRYTTQQGLCNGLFDTGRGGSNLELGPQHVRLVPESGSGVRPLTSYRCQAE